MKKKLFSIFTGILLIGLTSGIFAQANVKGLIVDADTQEPLIGAAVYLQSDKGVGTITMLDGTFQMPLEDGSYKLVFSYLGYIDLEKSIEVRGETDLGKIELASSSVGIVEVSVIASIAKDRETPVALSNIKPQLIEDKLGNQEFPEILKSTPSVYATKGGGGFGDSRITLRGFDSNNIGVLINGVPVNDMESGKVYWSNWAGLSDVTHSVQVQRGLGASRLALSSVGGTKNVITKSTEATKGGSAYVGMGNSGFMKQMFTVSTGLTENNWAVTVAGSHENSNGYIVGTQYEAFTYFLNVSKIINDNHRLSFTAFGAPQTHNQRGSKSTIEEYKSHRDGVRFNPNVGYRNGQIYGGGYGYNEYHKPQLSLNHYWTIDESMMLSTSVYASISQGGGRRTDGEGSPLKDAYGYIDFDSTIDANVANGESLVVEGNSVNQHKWYGILSTLSKSIGNIKITGGFDGRYYIGEHYKEVTDLYGGQFFMDVDDDGNQNNINRDPNASLKEGEKYAYHNDGVVAWGGLFGQAEYTTDMYSAFLTATVSSKNYKRIDYFQHTPDENATDWQGFTPWSVKGGFNYNINSQHNVYVNGGYFTRSPFFRTAFLNYTNEVNQDAKYEKVLSFDVGYGYRSSRFNAKLGGYYTNWQDKGLVRSFYDAQADISYNANIPGVNALHMGVELEFDWRPIDKMDIRGMFSLGEWVWQDDVDFTLLDDNNNPVGDFKAYLNGVHVGNAAQLTAALGISYEVMPKFKVGFDLNHYGKNYSEFDPTTRTDEDFTGDSWKLPDATLVDLNFRYGFKLGTLDATIYGNVFNLLNTEYIIDADDGRDHDMNTARVYYGFGTNWSTGLRVKF